MEKVDYIQLLQKPLIEVSFLVILISKHLNVFHFEDVLEIFELVLGPIVLKFFIGWIIFNIGIRSVTSISFRILLPFFLLLEKCVLFIDHLLLVVSKVHGFGSHELRKLVDIGV